VRTLTLIEPPALWVLGNAQDPGPEYRSLKNLSDSITDDISQEQLKQFACSVGLCPPGRSPEQIPQWDSWMTHRRSLLNTPAVFRHTDQLPRLDSFDKPVLLVKGKGSVPFLHRIIDVLASRLPRARVIELPAGHVSHIVSMDRFLEEMEAFQREQANARPSARSPVSG
jgi:pimeloyl-ACP methyl ester carboxylesterase